MGIENGSLAFTRYRVLGDAGPSTIDRLSKLIKPFCAPPLNLKGVAKPESLGWVRPVTASDEAIVGEESHWDISDCQVDGIFDAKTTLRKTPRPSVLGAAYV